MKFLIPFFSALLATSNVFAEDMFDTVPQVEFTCLCPEEESDNEFVCFGVENDYIVGKSKTAKFSFEEGSITGSALSFDSNWNDYAGKSNRDFVEYNITLPDPGVWYFWARFKYPSKANSFNFQLNKKNYTNDREDDSDSDSDSDIKGKSVSIGNNKNFEDVWHWDGCGSRGECESGEVQPLRVTTSSAELSFRLKKREVTPVAPFIDGFCFTRNAESIPTD